jgi:hypothetical protein
MLLALGLVSAAACGGAGAVGPIGYSTTTAGTGSGAAGSASASGSVASPSPSPSTTTSTITTGNTAVHVEMKAPIPSAMVGDLQALGIDAKSLPSMDKLDPKALRGVMKLFARSLGAKCGDCHSEGDFAAPTRRKKIAAKMWSEFAAKLTTSDGSSVFCDSCHQGRIVQLDRTDKKALGKWMDANFVDRLKRKDGSTQECESCHVDMEMQLLSKWAQ